GSRMLNGPRIVPRTLSTSSTMAWCSAGTSDLPVIGAILGVVSSWSLYAGIGFAPPVEIDDIRKGPAGDRPEPPHRVADRQDCVGVEAGRDTHRLLCLLLVLQMPRRQSRADAQSAGRQQH